VAGVPVQKITDDYRSDVEVPLLRGEWLIVDFDAKVVRLK
jgi:hypothetical protein